MGDNTVPLDVRLDKNTTISPSGCWLWTGYRTETGYGRISIKGRMVRVHRLQYERHIGPIPEGLTLDHLCRVRNCMNPAHLEAVPHAENIRRGMTPTSVWARTNLCKRGHSLADAYVDSKGGRTCRHCQKVRNSCR